MPRTHDPFDEHAQTNCVTALLREAIVAARPSAANGTRRQYAPTDAGAAR